MSINDKIMAIGGVGGSGTRVIADILAKCGYFTGYDLNESSDTLLFTLLFKHQSILTYSEDEFDYLLQIFIKIMSSNVSLTKDELTLLQKLASKHRTLHEKEWLQQRLQHIDNRQEHKVWGWKEPNTHIVIERLFKRMETLKFVYVYRNGLDMAYSNNQNQLKLWGGIFLNDTNLEINPKNSLKYWCTVHKRMLKFQEKFQDRVLMLNFDELCRNPKKILKDLGKFLSYNGNILEFESLIKAPSSIGRHKEFSLENFDTEDLHFLQTVYSA